MMKLPWRMMRKRCDMEMTSNYDGISIAMKTEHIHDGDVVVVTYPEGEARLDRVQAMYRSMCENFPNNKVLVIPNNLDVFFESIKRARKIRNNIIAAFDEVLKPDPLPSADFNWRELFFDLLTPLCSLTHGKQMYFDQDDGMVYSRISCKYMTPDEAITEYLNDVKFLVGE